MTYVGATVEGLEEASAKEVNGEKKAVGRISFQEFDQEKEYRTLEHIYELKEEGKVKNVEDIKALLEKANLPSKNKWKAHILRRGDQPFNSVMIEQVCREVGEKKSLYFSRKEAEEIIVIDVYEEDCFIGILKKEQGTTREYRLKLHNQTIPPVLAATFIKHLEASKKVFFPEAKDAVFPIEAALQKVEEITAQDTIPNNLRNAKINMQLAKVEFPYETKKITEHNKDHDYLLIYLIFSEEQKNVYKKIHELFSFAEKHIKKKVGIITNHPKEVDQYSTKEKVEEKEIQYKK